MTLDRCTRVETERNVTFCVTLARGALVRGRVAEGRVGLGDVVDFHEDDAAGGVGAADLDGVGTGTEAQEQRAIAAVFGEGEGADARGGGARRRFVFWRKAYAFRYGSMARVCGARGRAARPYPEATYWAGVIFEIFVGSST